MSDKANNMQFHEYLEELFGSRVSISLIKALVNYKGKIFTVRGLADAANVSPSEAARIVQQLEKYGLIKLQPVGKSYLVSLNERSYILNKIMKPIIGAEGETLDELVSVLKKHFSSSKENIIISAAIFGSVARGEEKEDSDIDLLVISNDFDSASTLVSGAQEEVSLIFNSRLSPVILSKKEFMTKKNDRLVRSIISSYMTVVGKDLRAMVEQK